MVGESARCWEMGETLALHSVVRTGYFVLVMMWIPRGILQVRRDLIRLRGENRAAAGSWVHVISSWWWLGCMGIGDGRAVGHMWSFFYSWVRPRVRVFGLGLDWLFCFAGIKGPKGNRHFLQFYTYQIQTEKNRGTKLNQYQILRLIFLKKKYSFEWKMIILHLA